MREGLQEEITSENMLPSDLVDDTNQTNKFVTAEDKTNWNGKVDPTDYASTSNAGVIKTSNTYATSVSSGRLSALWIAYTNFNSLSDYAFISKGTLRELLYYAYQSKIDSSHKLSADLVDDTSTTNKFVSSSDKTNWNGKQDATDNSLTTTNKTIPTAINEVNSMAKGANQALSYSNYSAMVTAFNSLASDVYNVGQNVMIVTLEVPDLWISGVESTSSTYTYVDDDTVVNELQTNGYIQVGHYKLSMLETQKVDLTNYVKNTNYASSSKGGVIKTSHALNVDSSGFAQCDIRTYAQYQNADSLLFIGKRTLENVITGKELVNKTYVDNIVGDIESILETLDVGTGV